MAIKDKDGKIYKLRGPNPLLVNQSRWQIENMSFYNFKWDSIILPDKNKTTTIREKEIVIQSISGEEEKEEDNNLEKIKSIFVCLPIKVEVFRDNLYDETYKKVTYGEKYTFEGILLSREDIAIEFWVSNPITQGSIVCSSLDEKRWWKVQDFFEKANGYVVQAIVSDYSPDLS